MILADLSAGLIRREGSNRWIDTDRNLCAQRLLRCAPWELVDHLAEEEQGERDEAARVAYVAATRAKDLLVACALGDSEYKDGWLQPLYDVLYPSKDGRRKPVVAHGEKTVLNAPAHPKEEQIRPGLHRPRTGDHQVLWFDPAMLALKDPVSQGADRMQLLTGTRTQIQAGLERYQAWRLAQTRKLEAGAEPKFIVRLATETEGAPDAESIRVEVIAIEADTALRGRRFGKLVHAVLQSGGSAAAHGRRLNATDDEIQTAERVATVVLSHELVTASPERTLFREMPVIVRLDDGTLIEGRIDLAWTDGVSWTVVDYKTNSTAWLCRRRQENPSAPCCSRSVANVQAGVRPASL